MWELAATFLILGLFAAERGAVGVPAMALPTGDTLKAVGAVLGGLAAAGTLLLAVLGRLGAAVAWLWRFPARRDSWEVTKRQQLEREVGDLLQQQGRFNTALSSANSRAEAAEIKAQRAEEALRLLSARVVLLEETREKDIDAIRRQSAALLLETQKVGQAELLAARLEHGQALAAVQQRAEAEAAEQAVDAEADKQRALAALRQQLADEAAVELRGLRAEVGRLTVRLARYEGKLRPEGAC